jgi:hypothetical protein
VPGPAQFHHEITDARRPPAEPVLHKATALATAVARRDPSPPRVERLVRALLLPRALLAAGVLGRHEARHLRERDRQAAQGRSHPAARGQGRRRRSRPGLLMSAAALGGTAKKEEPQGSDEQDVFHRVGFFLAALTRALCSRVLGADDAPFRPVMGQRGEAGAGLGGGLRQRGTPDGCLSRRAAEPLGQGGQRAGRGRAAGAPRGQQRGPEPVAPLLGLALAHADQAPMHHLQRRGLEVGEQAEEPIVRRRQGAVLVHGKPARGPRLSLHAPRRHPSLEGSCEGWDQLRKLVERHAGQIQELGGAGLQGSAP